MADGDRREHRVLALKWRPGTFSDVVGQPQVVQTLANALAQQRLSHAYLFTGPRGVGKTTCARILARAVNCERGAGPEPCGTCGVCLEIIQGRSLDVIEIDAASTGKTEDIRDLREVVRLAPARARRKVFIIDEVHSMAAQAYNALLKTLEEPPAHVMFILATTDAHKVPATIHSRCQRFDFHPLGPATVTAHLKRIAEAESIAFEEPGLALIARVARGAMRDAQMLLEQVASFADSKVTLSGVREFLGLVEREWVERFCEVLRDRDLKAGLALLDDLIEAGRSPDELLEEVQEELRDALMAKLGSSTAPLSAERFLASPERAGWFTEEELLALLAHVRRAIDELTARNLSHPRIAAELAVARLLRRERPLRWEEVEEQIGRLEASIRGAPPVAGAAPPGPPRPSSIAGPPPAPSPPPAGGTMPITSLVRRWNEVVAGLADRHKAAGAYLRGAKCLGVKDRSLYLEAGSSFYYQGLNSPEIQAIITRELAAQVDGEVVLVVRRPSGGAGSRGTDARDAAGDERSVPPGGAGGAGNPPPPSPDWIEREPAVKSAMEIFKARIIEIKSPQQR